MTSWFAGLRDIPTCSDWALTEFHSAISIKQRRGQISEAHTLRIRKEFGLLVEGGLRVVPVSRAAFRHAAEMVQQHTHGLRAGDSLHLAVGLEAGATQMATLDGTLAANAKRNSMVLIEF